MQKLKNQAYLAVIVIGFIFLLACTGEDTPQPLEVGSHPDLVAHSEEFEKEVIVVIVDAMESEEAAATVKEAFSKITSKSVKAIIYTHYHPDHTNGATVMAGDDNPEIYSHVATSYYMNRISTITRETTYRRAMRLVGTLLPEGGIINDGIGPRLEFDESKTLGMLPPTKTFSKDHLNLKIAGLSLDLYYAPGETPDQIFVWVPEKKVLLPAANSGLPWRASAENPQLPV